MKNPKSKRLKLLTDLEINEIYSLPEFTEQERIYYFTLSPAEEKILNKLLYVHSKVHFILQLGYFKAKYRLFKFTAKEVAVDLEYIMIRYLPLDEIPTEMPSRKIEAVNNKHILSLMNYNCSNTIAKQTLTERTQHLVRCLSKPIIIIRELLVYFKQKHIVFPEYSTVQDIVGKLLLAEEKRLQSVIAEHISAEIVGLLDKLLMGSNIAESIVAFKQHPKNFSHKQIQFEINKHKTYYPIYNFAKNFLPMLEISKQNIEYYASLTHFYGVYRLKKLPRNLCYLYLICYSSNRFQILNDHLIQTLFHYVDLYRAEAKQYAEKKVTETYNNIRKHLKSAGILLNMYTNDKLSKLKFKTVQKKAFKIMSKGEITLVSKYMVEQCIDKEAYEWEFHANNHQCIAINLRPIFMLIDFACHVSDSHLLDGVKFIKSIFSAGKKLDGSKVKSFPQILINKRIMPYIAEIKNGKTYINPYKYEFLVYQQLVEHINQGLVFCNDTIQYKSFEEDIGIKDKKAALKAIDILKLTNPIDKRLDEFENQLENLIVEVNDRIKNNENIYIKLKGKGDDIKWTLPYVKKEEPEFNNPIYDQLPHANIINVVDFVDADCQFIKELTHIKPYKSKEIKAQYVKGCLIANATGLGTYKMAENSNLDYTTLHTTEKSCFRLEALVNANNVVIAKTAELPIFKHHNLVEDLLHSSLDGQKLLSRRDTFKSRYSAKYFGFEKGIVNLRMILNGIAIGLKVVGPNEYEGHYLYDMLFNNSTSLELDRVSTDTHGTNQVNFALLDFLDIEFMPCYRSLVKRVKNICGFKNLSAYEGYIIKPARKVNKALIKKEWPNIQPIIAALMMKETTQHIVVKKLCSHKIKSKTKEALWEYNNILMSIYLLKYVNDINIRRLVRATLNRGEAHNQLCSLIASVGGVGPRGASDLEIEMWSECTRLLANVIVYYNGYIMSQVMLNKEQHGNLIAAEFIRKLSLIAVQHLNLQGYYEFDVTAEPIDVEDIILQMSKILGK